MSEYEWAESDGIWHRVAPLDAGLSLYRGLCGPGVWTCDLRRRGPREDERRCAICEAKALGDEVQAAYEAVTDDDVAMRLLRDGQYESILFRVLNRGICMGTGREDTKEIRWTIARERAYAEKEVAA